MCRTWGLNSGMLACQADSLLIELPHPVTRNEPVQVILVLITRVNSKGSCKPMHLQSLTTAFAVHESNTLFALISAPVLISAPPLLFQVPPLHLKIEEKKWNSTYKYKETFYRFKSSQILPLRYINKKHSILKTPVNVYNAYLATPPYFREKNARVFLLNPHGICLFLISASLFTFFLAPKALIRKNIWN